MRSGILVLLSLAVAAPAAAQDWTQIYPTPAPGERSAPSFVYDAVREQIVLFGGLDSDPLDETWILEGDVWTELHPPVSPPARHEHHSVWHASDERVVIFGGTGSSVVWPEMWAWDGTVWSSSMPAAPPPERQAASVAYDSARDRIVLFGGMIDGPPDVLFADTWEYDGTTWEDVTPTSSPTARWGASMGYDPVRGLIVLVGGIADPNPNDTWTYDGSTWTPVGDAPPAFTGSEPVAWDPFRGQLMRVSIDSGVSAYHFDGSAWNLTAAFDDPRATLPADQLAFDESRGYAVNYGRGGGSTPVGYSLDATGWAWLLPVRTPGAPGARSALWVDETLSAPVVRGDLSDIDDAEMWRWDGDHFRPLDVIPTPFARADSVSAYAYDTDRDVAVVHEAGVTWEVRGGEWRQVTSATMPPARSLGTMAYDAGRRVSVLFGGTTGFDEYLDDTWEWDGTDWRPVTTAGAPPARRSAAMAYDATRGRIVLYGGLGLEGGSLRFLVDTWEYDGASWAPITTATVPPQMDEPSMAYDPGRRRTLLWGEQSISSGVLWEYDGRDWIGGDRGALPGDEQIAVVAYDPMNARMMVYTREHELWVRPSGPPMPGTDGGVPPGVDGGTAGSDGGTSGSVRDGGCGCRVSPTTGGRSTVAAFALALLAVVLRAMMSRPK